MEHLDRFCARCGGAIVHRQAAARYCSSECRMREAHRIQREQREGLESMKKHPGFAKVQSKIEKEGYSPKAAGAILAAKTRGASKAAKKANPRLKRV
jgi:hypothetical protein